MLRPKQLGRSAHRERAAEFEAKIAQFIAWPILWARGVRKREALVGVTAIVISLGFIAVGVMLFTKVTFNIFPPAKDGNEIAVTLTFPAGTTITQAEEMTDGATKRLSSTLGSNLDHMVNFGAASGTSARFDIYLVDYSKRDASSHELVTKVKQAFQGAPGGVTATAQTVEIAPASTFEAHVNAETNRDAAIRLASDIAAYLKKVDITRIDGSAVKFSSVAVEGVSTPLRTDGKSYISVAASFVDDDTTTQINRTKAAIVEEFTPARVASYGLSESALSYEFGLEEQNQSSFASLLVAFPVVLLIIFIVLAVQFRSVIQPLLIFMAVPFSIFGVMLGLYLTDNAFSFFAMLGFFALIGLSIKNTILLTDYANQARRAGKSPVDAIHDALAERFRPLIATSLTAIVSLIPLAVASPFWQGLVVVLIGGLLSSTFLVITVFPYYYLGGEFIRLRFMRRRRSDT